VTVGGRDTSLAEPARQRDRLADRYRSGRVFLVGDAAHTQPRTGARPQRCGIAPEQTHPSICHFRPWVIDSEGPKLADRVRRSTATQPAPAMSLLAVRNGRAKPIDTLLPNVLLMALLGCGDPARLR
jgi:hypothetical protein